MRGRVDGQLPLRIQRPRLRDAAVARPLVMELQQGILAEEQFNPGVSTRPFTFALSDVGEMVFLPKLLERLRSQAPRAGIRSVSMPPHQIAEGLEKGDIDLTIGY